MKYTLHYFASLADQADCAEEIWETTLSEPRALYAELRLQHGFKLDASQLRIAINGEFADWHRALVDGDEIVFLPPVSGG